MDKVCVEIAARGKKFQSSRDGRLQSLALFMWLSQFPHVLSSAVHTRLMYHDFLSLYDSDSVVQPVNFPTVVTLENLMSK